MNTDDIKVGEGKVIDSDGKKIAIDKDENGKVVALSPICTHKACIIGWNSKDKTWDCPCHGSRFDATGKVINGPAEKNLEKIALT